MDFLRDPKTLTGEDSDPGFCYPDETGSIRVDRWMLCKSAKLDNQ